MAGKILVVGSLNMDLVGCASRIPVAGETVTGRAFFDEPGGKGANQAYAAARLGGKVAMLGRVGSDDYGRRMRGNLERVGCDVSGVMPIPNCASGSARLVANESNSTLAGVQLRKRRKRFADTNSQRLGHRHRPGAKRCERRRCAERIVDHGYWREFFR